MFGTNILIDYLKGILDAQNEFGRYEQKSISIITWMEVLIGATPEHMPATRDFLDGFHLTR